MHHYRTSLGLVGSVVFICLNSFTTAAPSESHSNIPIDKSTCDVTQTSLIEEVLWDAKHILQHANIITQESAIYRRYMDNTGADQSIFTQVTKRIRTASAAMTTKHHKRLTISCHDETSEFCDDGQAASTDPNHFQIHLCPAFFDNSKLLNNVLKVQLPCHHPEIKYHRLSSFFSNAQTMLHELMHLGWQDDEATAVIDCYYGPYWSAQGAKYRPGVGAYNTDSYAWMLMGSYLNELCKVELDWHDADEYMFKAGEQPMGIQPYGENTEDGNYGMCYLWDAPKIAPFTDLPRPLDGRFRSEDYL